MLQPSSGALCSSVCFVVGAFRFLFLSGGGLAVSASVSGSKHPYHNLLWLRGVSCCLPRCWQAPRGPCCLPPSLSVPPAGSCRRCLRSSLCPSTIAIKMSISISPKMASGARAAFKLAAGLVFLIASSSRFFHPWSVSSAPPRPATPPRQEEKREGGERRGGKVGKERREGVEREKKDGEGREGREETTRKREEGEGGREGEREREGEGKNEPPQKGWKNSPARERR